MDKRYEELAIVISEKIDEGDYYYSNDTKYIEVENSAQIAYIMNPRVLSQCKNIKKISIHAHGSPVDNIYLYKDASTNKECYYISVNYVGEIIGKFLNSIGVSNVNIECIVCFSADSCYYGRNFSLSSNILRTEVKNSVKGSLIDNLRNQIKRHYSKEFTVKGFTGQAGRLSDKQRFRSAGDVNAKYYFDTFNKDKGVVFGQKNVFKGYPNLSKNLTYEDYECLEEQFILFSELGFLDYKEKKEAIDRILTKLAFLQEDHQIDLDTANVLNKFFTGFLLNKKTSNYEDLLKLADKNITAVKELAESINVNYYYSFKNAIRSAIDKDYSITINQHGNVID
ncbi:hypothetical protein [Allofrancisella frigidaquae]|uniref:hypothetical protein n=1 Tax=Allofrancisella frigidaquae TaxID=1085644 RepID=UPI00155713AC|nr:hypothetical protein [Allofrancisella frigidaquae]